MIKHKELRMEGMIKGISILATLLFILFSLINFRAITSLNEINNVNDQVFSKYYVFIIIISSILFMLLAFVLILSKRLLNINIPYILRTLKNVSNYNYDVSYVNEITTYFKEEENLKEVVEDVYKEQTFLQEVKNIAANEYVLDDVLDKIFDKLNTFVKVDRIGVAFVDYGKRRIVAETAKISYGSSLLGAGFEVSMDNTPLTDSLISKRPVFCNDIMKDCSTKEHKNKSIKLIMDEGIKSNMIIPLVIEDKVFGFLFFSSFDKNSYDERSLRIGENISHAIATIIDQTYLTKRMLSNITVGFAELVEKKDLETGNHINRMTRYSKIIAEGLINHENDNYRVNNSFIHDLELYAPLHDIGKVGIPDNILNKPAKLTGEEWAIMKEHTNIGADILSDLKKSLQIFGKSFYEMAINVTRYHHEKWDGSGYPCSLKGEEIPLEARIVAIADVFDALASRRPYKESKTFNECVDIIKKGRGSHFDPELVDVFLECLPEIQKVYNRDILNSQFAKVVSL